LQEQLQTSEQSLQQYRQTAEREMAELRKTVDRTSQQIEQTNKQIGGITSRWGEFVENLSDQPQ